MPSLFRTPKTLSGWTELDYFERRRFFRGWYWALGTVAVLGSVALIAGLVYAGGNQAFQAGPLSPPHQMFNHDCGKCHQGGPATWTRLWRGDQVGTVTDAACQQCHAGAHHNENATMARCVSCHREHRGHAELVRIDDAHCTACHADPSRHAIRGFSRSDADHPDFRWRRGNEKEYRDPGTIHFNHAAHLAEGGVLTIDEGQVKARRNDLLKKGIDPDTVRPPLTRKQLTCQDCHRTDSEGRYFQPITYDRHCKECHPIGMQIVGDWTDAKLKELVWQFGRQHLHHPAKGQGVESVRAALRQRLADFIATAQGTPFLTKTLEAAPRLPDRGDAPTERRQQAEYDFVNEHLARTEEILYTGGGGCRYCHRVTKDAVIEGARKVSLPALAPPNIPDRWWRHASFKHDTHRMMKCTDCHDAAGSVTNRDVLLPGKDTCVKCHDSRKPGSARADCVECHTFHDPRLQRDERDRGGRLTIDWLRAR